MVLIMSRAPQPSKDSSLDLLLSQIRPRKNQNRNQTHCHQVITLSKLKIAGTDPHLKPLQ